VTDLKTLRPYFDRLAEDAIVGAQGRTRTPAPLVLASQDESVDVIVADIPRAPHGRTGRWRLAVAVAAAAALIVATIVLVRTASNDGGTVLTPAGPAPTAPAPSSSAPAPTPLGAPLVQGPDPASTLLTSWGEIHVGYAFVYADGRVIWYPDIFARVDAYTEVIGAQRLQRTNGLPTPDGEFLYQAIERHLSPHGLELVRAGELTPKQFLYSNPDPHRVEELWAEPTARIWEPVSYAICSGNNEVWINATDVLGELPAPAQVLLNGKERIYDPSIGTSHWAGTASGQLPICFEVTAAEVENLYQIFLANGQIVRIGDPWEPPNAWRAKAGRVALSPIAIYPHGQYVIWGG
jgi:hypothetical protein